MAHTCLSQACDSSLESLDRGATSCASPSTPCNFWTKQWPAQNSGLTGQIRNVHVPDYHKEIFQVQVTRYSCMYCPACRNFESAHIARATVGPHSQSNSSGLGIMTDEKDATTEMGGTDAENQANEPECQDKLGKWACCVGLGKVGCEPLAQHRKTVMWFIQFLSILGLAFCVVGCVGLSDHGAAIKNVPWAKYTVKTSKKEYDVYMNLEALRIDFPGNSSAQSLTCITFLNYLIS